MIEIYILSIFINNDDQNQTDQDPSSNFIDFIGVIEDLRSKEMTLVSFSLLSLNKLDCFFFCVCACVSFSAVKKPEVTQF